jgi:hypothetical protein
MRTIHGINRINRHVFNGWLIYKNPTIAIELQPTVYKWGVCYIIDTILSGR